MSTTTTTTTIMSESPEFVTDVDNIKFKLIGKVTNESSVIPSMEDTPNIYKLYVCVLSYVPPPLRNTNLSPRSIIDYESGMDDTWKDVGEDDDEIMDVYANAPYSIFWVYRSTSELGMWRLGGTYPNTYHQMNKLSEYQVIPEDFEDHRYYAGDYVQSTLIKLELQMFLNANLDALPKLTRTDAFNIMEYINNTPNVDTVLTPANCTSPYAPITSDDEASPSLIPENVDGRRTIGLRPLDGSLPELNPIVRAIHGNNVFFPFPFVYMSIDHILRDGEMMGQPPPPPPTRGQQSQNFYTQFQCGRLGDIRLLFKFSRLLEGVYNLQYPPAKVVDHVNVFDKTIGVEGAIYKAVLTKKPESEIEPRHLKYELDYDKRTNKSVMITADYEDDILPAVDLYFLKTHMNCLNTPSWFLQNVKRVCDTETHYMPIILTVPGVTINRFGIYTKYINSGSYVCKMFDYHYQCFPDETSTGQCTGNYTYIGHRYTRLFPFKNIIDNDRNSAKSGGSRRRRHLRKTIRATAKTKAKRGKTKKYRQLHKHGHMRTHTHTHKRNRK